jgi:GTP-binding protein HflX
MHVNIFAPYSEGWILPYICQNGSIVEQSFVENGVEIVAIINKLKVKRLENYYSVE